MLRVMNDVSIKLSWKNILSIKQIFQPLHQHIHHAEERVYLNTLPWKLKVPLALKSSIDFS